MKTSFGLTLMAVLVCLLILPTASTWAEEMNKGQENLVPTNWIAASKTKRATTQKAGVPTKKTLKSDLIVSGIQLTTDNRIKVTIKNKGRGGVPDGAYNKKYGVAVQVTGNNKGWGGYRLFMVDPQKKLKNPGASVSYAGFKRALNPGETLSLKVAIHDPKNTANESSKSNNSLTRRLIAKNTTRVSTQRQQLGHVKNPPRLKPDLTIKMMKITPANPTTADTIRFSAFVHNKGAATAPASKAGIRIGGETYPMVWNKPPITSQSSNAIVRLNQIERAGTYRVMFIADVNDDVDEIKENNNQDFLEFTVTEPPLPDLVVSDITPDSNCFLRVTLTNNGGPIPASVNLNMIRINFTKNGVPYGFNNVNLIDPNCNLCQPNGSVTFTQGTNTGSTGPWVLNKQAVVEVDALNQVTEQNENNNEMTKNTYCPPPN
jgi:hypothetical protein